jgi:hypothetical protein
VAVYYDSTGHLVADTLAELHEFAVKKLGFKRSWFAHRGKSKYLHYDLTTPNAKRRAARAGAIKISELALLYVCYRAGLATCPTREVFEAAKAAFEREMA